MEVKLYRDKKIGVAVSGGADSMVLLDCYLRSGQNIAVINVEHGIRGAESLRDSEFVARFCAENNLELLQYSLDTLGASAASGESVELCARRLRYAVFDGLIADKKVDLIALAHHADDNAETVLMRILRGTGIKGLCGITDRDSYIHPLIKYTKAEILSYAEQNGIEYVTDCTNLNSDYTRNYLRNEIMPLIKARFPEYASTFSRLSENAKETEEYLSSAALPMRKEGDRIYLDDAVNAPVAVLKYSINAVLQAFGCMQDIELRHLEYVVSLLGKNNNTVIDLPFNVEVIFVGKSLIFRKKREKCDYYEEFNPDKKYFFCDYDYEFTQGAGIEKGISADADKIPPSAVIRTFRNGDRFKKVNGRTKKLSDFFNEKKLCVWDREEALLLCDDGEVLAVLGIETGDKIKIDENTKKILLFKRRKAI